MAIINSKFFGELEYDEKSDFEYIEAIFEENGKEHNVDISLSDCNMYGDKINICKDIIDKYPQVCEIANLAIVNAFSKDETVKDYFLFHFDNLKNTVLVKLFGTDNFANFDVKKTMQKISFPSLLFSLDDNEIVLSVDYKISEEDSDEMLCVKMNAKLEVTGFTQES